MYTEVEEDESEGAVSESRDIHHRDGKSGKPLIIFNVMPKSGSRTLQELVEKLFYKNKTKTNLRNTMGGNSETQEDKMKIIRQALRSNETEFVYTHMRFKPYRYNGKKPIYISIVRDPIDRLASFYYFVRYGDNKVNLTIPEQQFRENMKAKNLSNTSFDECVLNEGASCRNPAALVRHFCGYSCQYHNNTARRKSFNKAIANINRNYLVVGIMEDYLSILKVLENLIPQVFSGIASVYENEKRTILEIMKTKEKTEVSQQARNKLKSEMEEDYKLYDILKKRFERLKKKHGILHQN
ncbi:Heparan sulfate 2-O-sulfotransferase 1 [Holothuria leucospilota]|uniref:Heparan sulfate 2-O-sulfotransferase 1 n=1 Tax=Holothuria leucospilota TaxID=206669 RepID=A0A9Q1CH52_HOLLE|nr:Heparan sulfate 2-O-sulfotransferase 1 [Holothuria leucospilota]